MPTPGGLRHWPRHSGYFESSAAKATAQAAHSAAANATVVAERRNSMRNLHTFGSAREITQVRCRLAWPRRREIAVWPDHIHLRADLDMIAAIGANGFAVHCDWRAVTPIGLAHGPGLRQCAVVHRDLVDENVRVGLVEEDALADHRVVVLVQRQAGAIEIARALEMASLGHERIKAAVAVAVLPLPDGETAEARIDLARPWAAVGVDAARVMDILDQDKCSVGRDEELDRRVGLHDARHAGRLAGQHRVGDHVAGLVLADLLEARAVLRSQRRVAVAGAVEAIGTDAMPHTAEVGILGLVESVCGGRHLKQRGESDERRRRARNHGRHSRALVSVAARNAAGRAATDPSSPASGS